MAELSTLINEQSKGLLQPPITTVQPRPAHIPLSFSQERLWFIDKLEGSIDYHISSVLRLEGHLNKDALEHTLQTIVDRHEALRTVFYEDDGRPYQHIKDKDGYKLAVIDGSEYKEDRQGLRELFKKLTDQPFNLSKDYMLRAALINIDAREHMLVVTMHHIASDAWSTPIIVQEVVELYSAYTQDRQPQLPSLDVQYTDYAVWQRNYLQGEVLDKKLGYWKQKLQGVASLQLPTDYVRPAVRSTLWCFRQVSILIKSCLRRFIS